MIPPTGIHNLLFTLAHTSFLIALHPDTPRTLRRLILEFGQEINARLPKSKRQEIKAIRTEATIKAACYLRRPDS